MKLSHEVARDITDHRNNDLVVLINGRHVPVAGVRYDRTADQMVIDLVDGEDLAVALAPDPDGTVVDG